MTAKMHCVLSSKAAGFPCRCAAMNASLSRQPPSAGRGRARAPSARGSTCACCPSAPDLASSAATSNGTAEDPRSYEQNQSDHFLLSILQGRRSVLVASTLIQWLRDTHTLVLLEWTRKESAEPTDPAQRDQRPRRTCPRNARAASGRRAAA